MELDIDLAGDLAMLKKNLAKLKRGKHGKGLQDIMIQELDWVQKLGEKIFQKISHSFLGGEKSKSQSSNHYDL